MSAAKYLVFVTLAVAVFIGLKTRGIFEKKPLPELTDKWWGPGEPTADEDPSIRPFKIQVTQEILDDLKMRLDTARPFTPPLEGVQQQYGMNTNLLREIVDFWRSKYDWKSREKLFNQYAHFKTAIQGLDIHFMHVKPAIPKGENVEIYPLLMIHGWPGSVRELFEIIPLLTSIHTPKTGGQKFTFEVIAPSIPGFGFSSAAVRPGLGPAAISLIFKKLMQRLGFDKFYAQGGDYGGIIVDILASHFPQNLVGYHSNMCIVQGTWSQFKIFLASFHPTLFNFTRAEHVNRLYPLGEYFARIMREMGYMHLQATKPDTIGVALKDSPAGLAAYILEKFTTGTSFSYQLRVDGGLKEAFDYETLLDNIMVYWVTGSMPTAMRLYAETFNKKYAPYLEDEISVPVACARAENDFYSPDGVLGDKYKKLVHLSDFQGGHFAALQVPHVLAEDIFEAFEEITKHAHL